MASKKITDLHPLAQEVITLWLHKCNQRGIQVLVYCTFRPNEEQDSLYNLGRTVVNPQGKTVKKPMGNIVTNAKAGQSFHQYKVA